MRSIHFVVSILFFLSLSVSSFSGAIQYDHSMDLDPSYSIQWTIFDGTLKLGINVSTTLNNAWIGFGISENTTGSMPGADVVVISVVDGETVIEDRYTTAFAKPSLDKCENWKLHKTILDGDRKIFELSRALDTNDTQDRAITEGENRVIWAIGQGKELSYHGPSTDHRGATIVHFYEEKKNNTLPPSTLSYSLLMPNVTIPAQKTTYMCKSFELPNVTQAHIIEINPIISPETQAHVHHFLVHICKPSVNRTGDSDWERYEDHPQECPSPLGDVEGGCFSLLYGWAVGAEKLVMPPEAGFRTSGIDPNAVHYLILEIHYDNGDKTAGMVDTSGIEVFYTTEMREYDAAMMVFGDPGLDFAPIPEGRSNYHVESNCPSECTKEWDHDIHVVYDFLHMHQIGKQMVSTHWNEDGEFIDYMNRADFYVFAFQNNVPVTRTISRGDRINTHCVYDSTSRSAPTKFGVASTDEMCLDFITYYPALVTKEGLPYSFCGFFNESDMTAKSMSICGSPIPQNLFPNLPNPTITDPDDVLTVVFGMPLDECPASEESWWNKLGIEGQIGVVCGFIGLLLVIFLVIVIISVVRRRRQETYKRVDTNTVQEHGFDL